MVEGYKNTEVGVIPSEWEIFPLEELSYRIGDGIHTTPKYIYKRK
jgi:type I restriction enzyme S subunit